MALVHEPAGHAPGEDDCEGCRKIAEEVVELSLSSEESDEYEDGEHLLSSISFSLSMLWSDQAMCPEGKSSHVTRPSSRYL